MTISIAGQREIFYQGINPRYFNLILFPTEQCSFRCTYCYEDFLIGKMSPDVITGVKRLIESRTENVDRFDLSWFGGEPLLAKDVIFEIHEFIRSLKRDFVFSANMTTNGFHLDGETATRLCALGVDAYQISLDGQREEHDKTRVAKGGGKTFDKILSNLVGLKSIPGKYKVILRVHFHPGNLDSVRALARDLVNEFSQDGRFKIFFKNIGHLGGKRDNEFAVFSYADSRKTRVELEALVADKGMLYDDSNTKLCYAAALNSFAIRANGRIAKCTVALDSDENSIGSLTREGRMILDNAKLRKWARGLESADPLELQCPLHAPPRPR